MEDYTVEAGSFGLMDHAHSVVERADGSYSDDGVQVNLAPMVVGESFRVGGVFSPVECWGPDGKLRWVQDAKNAIVNDALDQILNTFFENGTPASALYMGLVDNSGFTAFASSDTAGSHTGWSENTAYSSGTRPAWAPGASSGQTITNGTAVSFSITSNGNIRGLFIATTSTKSDTTTHSLIATAPFSGGVQAVNNGDTLKVTYTVSAAST